MDADGGECLSAVILAKVGLLCVCAGLILFVTSIYDGSFVL